jgi:hypothetical protein
MTRQGELLLKPKRKMRGQLMHVSDAGDADGLICKFRCKKCGFQSEWLKMPTVTEAKRGIPCPKCNGEGK